MPKGGGRYSVGKPYQVAGGWYTPREDPSYDAVGRASWYGELFHGRYTANGEIYDMDRLTAAHPTLPLPVYARVTNLANGRAIVVRVNDRGPYASDRIMDLSRRSADALGFRKNGTAQVRVTYLGKAPLNGDDSYERRYLASQGWAQYATAKRIRPAADPIAVASIASVGTPPRKATDKLASRLGATASQSGASAVDTGNAASDPGGVSAGASRHVQEPGKCGAGAHAACFDRARGRRADHGRRRDILPRTDRPVRGGRRGGIRARPREPTGLHRRENRQEIEA